MARVYEYDVFISYKRDREQVPAWIRRHFYPRLVESLDNNSDRDLRIFYDELLPGGSSASVESYKALRHSRILLPVCSPKYFFDEWCLAEWHSMAQREELVGLTASPRQQGLIYPVIFCDSKNFPKYATDRRMWDLKTWNLHYPHFQESPQYLDFHRAVEKIAVELVDVIERAPEWQPDWPVSAPSPGSPGTPGLPRL